MKRNKKLLALLLTLALSTSMLAACGGSSSTSSTPDTSTPATTDTSTPSSSDNVIKVATFTNEVKRAVEAYLRNNSDFANEWEVEIEVVSDADGAYESWIEQRWINNDFPDLYTAESAFVLKYTQGSWSDYAANYEDMIPDFASKLSAAQIAQYGVDLGTKNGKVVGLRYQETGCCLIYNRSIAKDTWGTDDPDEIAAITGPGWDKFLEAAADLKAKDYYIVSGFGDVWQAIKDGAAQGWVVNDALVIDPARESAFDFAKIMNDNGYWAGSGQWGDNWYADMSNGQVFGFLGPAWLINYVIAGRAGDTFGDWAVTKSPVEWTWGGTWILGSNRISSDAKKAAVGQIIEWITLDTSETGFQYHWANMTLDDEATAKDTVASGVVMAKSDGTLEFLGGQDMFDWFIPAGANGKADNWTEYDRYINSLFQDQVAQYYEGNKTKDEAIASFREAVKDQLGFE
jgi:hypothetical protein